MRSFMPTETKWSVNGLRLPAFVVEVLAESINTGLFLLESSPNDVDTAKVNLSELGYLSISTVFSHILHEFIQ